MESARIHRRNNLIDRHIGWLMIANRSAAECTNTHIEGSRYRWIRIVEMHFRERHATSLRRLVGDEWTSVDDAIGAPDHRTTGSGKQLDITRPAAPIRRWHVHGSCSTCDLHV